MNSKSVGEGLSGCDGAGYGDQTRAAVNVASSPTFVVDSHSDMHNNEKGLLCEAECVKGRRQVRTTRLQLFDGRKRTRECRGALLDKYRCCHQAFKTCS